MPEYRTPEEDREQDAQEARVRAVLNQAVADTTSLFVAMDLGEPADVVELWIDRVWNGLRDGLSDDHPQDPKSPLRHDEDRLCAIVLLITEQARTRAKELLREVADA